MLTEHDYWCFVSRTPTFLSKTILWKGWGCSMVPSQSHCSQPLHGVLRTRSSKHCSKYPQVLAQVCGWHFCHPQGDQQTRLPSTHQQCWPCYKVYSGDNKEDGSIPSWTPLLNLRLMAHYLSLCTGNLHILTSTCSGIVTITSQPNLVSSTPSPIGPPQCVASLSCSNRKRTHLRKALTKCKYPKWALDEVEKRLNRSTSEAIDRVNNQVCPTCHQRS